MSSVTRQGSQSTGHTCRQMTFPPAPKSVRIVKVLSDDLGPNSAIAPDKQERDSAGSMITSRRLAFAAGFLLSLLLTVAFVIAALVLNHVRG